MAARLMSRPWQQELVRSRPRIAGLMMAAPSVLLVAGLRSHGTIGHHVRLGAAAALILLIVAAVAAIAWANIWPKEAKEKLKQFQAQKRTEQPEPRAASRDPRV